MDYEEMEEKIIKMERKIHLLENKCERFERGIERRDKDIKTMKMKFFREEKKKPVEEKRTEDMISLERIKQIEKDWRKEE